MRTETAGSQRFSWDDLLHSRTRDPWVIQDDHAIRGDALRARAAATGRQLQAAGCRRIAVGSDRADVILIALTACQATECDLLLLPDGLGDKHVHAEHWRADGYLDDELALQPLHGTERAAGDAAIYLSTSGTGGEPKVVRHAWRSLVGRVPAGVHDPNRGARWLLAYQATSFAGLQVMLTSLLTDSVLIATSGTGVADIGEAALRWGPTHASGTPTFWRGFLMALGPRVGEVPLRQVTLGGEAADDAILHHLRQAFPTARIAHIYATTETGALFSVTDGKPGFPARWLERGPGDVRLRIRDDVLEVMSPRAMRGYLGDAGEARWEQSWISTGDVVRVVADRVVFVGRTDSTINVGGAKVMPEEVEAALLRLPAVFDARVFGVRNPITGAVLAAEVVLRSGWEADDARRAIQGDLQETLERHKIPRIVRVLDALPTTGNRKKDRSEC